MGFIGKQRGGGWQVEWLAVRRRGPDPLSASVYNPGTVYDDCKTMQSGLPTMRLPLMSRPHICVRSGIVALEEKFGFDVLRFAGDATKGVSRYLKCFRTLSGG